MIYVRLRVVHITLSDRNANRSVPLYSRWRGGKSHPIRGMGFFHRGVGLFVQRTTRRPNLEGVLWKRSWGASFSPSLSLSHSLFSHRKTFHLLFGGRGGCGVVMALIYLGKNASGVLERCHQLYEGLYRHT